MPHEDLLWEVREASRKADTALKELRGSKAKRKLDVADKLTIFVCFIFTATLIFIMISWVLWREYPAGVAQFTRWFISVGLPSYLAKKGYDRYSQAKYGDKNDFPL